MDNEHAKLILAAYRPNGRDAQDPSFSEALRQAEIDPELQRLLSEQTAFDQRMIKGLESVTPPGSAKSRALAAMRVTRQRRVRRNWTWPLALAASIALVATITTTVLRRPDQISLPQTASIEGLAGYLAEHHASIGLMNDDYSALVTWIQSRGGPVPENLPAALANLPVLGCQTWNTDHGKVSLVCFVGPDRTMLHLYVFDDASALPSPPPMRGAPRIERLGTWAMASWQEGGRGYVLGMPAEGDAAAALAPFVTT